MKKILKPLIAYDDDLTKHTSWGKRGYVVARLFEDFSDYKKLQKVFHTIVVSAMQNNGFDVKKDFKLVNYHRLVDTDERHYELIKQMGNFFAAKELGKELLEKLEKRASELCQKPVHAKHPDFDNKAFNIRIVRPQSKDNNPLHRDVWLDRLRNGINIYVPIAGSNNKSSLPLVPESHYWDDDVIERTPEGAAVDGRQYTVPSVLKIKRDYKLIRPNPQENEVLLFSPYLLHGGASNYNKNMTRVSLEMRFWRKG